jgi:hypothetical protein
MSLEVVGKVLDETDNLQKPNPPSLPLPNSLLRGYHTQVKLPPLIPPKHRGENGKISSLPSLQRGGLGWGNLRNNGDSITCVYTVAFIRGRLGRGKTFTAISNHIRYILAPSSLAGRGLGVGFLFRV